MGTIGGIAAFLAVMAFGVIQAIVGYIGIKHGIGTGWAIAALVVAFGFRFTLPLSIGTFFGAMNWLDWHWFWALLLAAPGLLFMVPGFISIFLERVKPRRT